MNSLLRTCLLISALLWALAFLAIDSWQRGLRIEVVTQVPLRPNSEQPEHAGDSSSGYRWDQHVAILPFYVDCYNWIQQTQILIKRGDWRLRSINYDRQPEGREVHWSGSFRWWLTAIAWAWHEVGGMSLPLAVELSAPWASPLFLALVVCGGAIVVSRRFNTAAGAVSCITLVCIFDFYQNFAVGNVDHHGMVAVCVFATVFCLVAGGAGWVRRMDHPAASIFGIYIVSWFPTRDSARRWFIASGLAGGAGLWISAATIVPVLVGTGLGAVIAHGWLGRAPRIGDRESSLGHSPLDCAPMLWLEWAIAGALSSLAFYVLEYFPNHFEWRLEINHPLYALAWLGGGLLIWQTCEMAVSRQFRMTAKSAVLWILGFVAVGQLPLIIALTHEKTFHVADPFLWALHVNYITEFQSLPKLIATESVPWMVASTSIIPILGAVLAGLLFNKVLFRPIRAMLALVLGPGFLMTLLGWKQVRWLGMADSVWIVGLLVVTWILTTPGTGLRCSWRHYVLAACFFVAVVLPYPLTTIRHWPTVAPSPEDYFQVVTRDVAHWLRKRLGGADVAILSGPTASSLLAYYGGFRVEGTLYWENVDGLKDAAAIFSATDQEKARRLLKAHGIDYIVLISSDTFDEQYAQLASGLNGVTKTPRNAFIHQIVRSHILPKWLRPLPYPSQELPHLRSMPDFFVGVFEVVPDQSDAEAGVRNAQFLIDIGQQTEALRHIEVALSSDRDFLPALIVSARLEKNVDIDLLHHIVAQVSAASSMEWADRVDLALLLLKNGLPFEGRRELVACWATATEANLRRLRPDACFEFLDRSRQLQLPGGLSSELQVFASDLLTPNLRSKLNFETALTEHLAGNYTAAILHYRAAIAAAPNYTSALNNLAMILASSSDSMIRNGHDAVELARRAARLDHYSEPGSMDTLACAYAEIGDFTHAAIYASRAEAFAERKKDRVMAAEIETHAKKFAGGESYRSPN